MDRGPLLRTVASLMFPFMAVLVLYLLLNGHNRAGGGFIAGVLMAGAIGFQFLAHGADGVVGAVALIRGYPFLTSFHAEAHVPVLGIVMEFGLAQAFDAGIFLLVVGGLVTAVLALREE